ncbi:MAG: hypothetical protein QM831_14745 [Kofleriaceae bacterium]
MRKLLAVALLAGCSTDEPVGPDVPQPIDAVWGDSIHAGDMFVLVPGTSSYDYIATVIDPMTDAIPTVDPRKQSKIGDDSVVFEAAIASAHRAGIPDEQLEDGTITFAIWGVDFQNAAHTSFIYTSYEGLHVPIQILGGANKCTHGSVPSNLLNYNADNASADATSLYKLTQTYLAAHPGSGRNIILSSHSWGGADAEYLVENLATIQSANGPLTDGTGEASIAFTTAMGVPGFVLGYSFKGPGLRNVGAGLLYEIDRPDDPVHALHAGEPGGGHQYSILYGDDFQGSYGITTEEMSCDTVPGPCAQI